MTYVTMYCTPLEAVKEHVVLDQVNEVCLQFKDEIRSLDRGIC